VPLVAHPFFTRLDYTMREFVRQSPHCSFQSIKRPTNG